MTTPGTGGLPAQRLDQQRNLPPPTSAPGAAAGVVRARQVIVSGAGAVGVFVYNGVPGAGNPPIASLTSGTVDPFGNPVVPGVVAYPTVDGDTYAVELANLTDPFGNTVAALTFADMSSPPVTPAAVTALSSSAGSGMTLQSGNGVGATGADLSVFDSTESGTPGGLIVGNAKASFPDMGISGTFTASAGTINGITFKPFTLVSPGATAGNPPSGSGTASASTVAGALLSYFDALAATYNTTVTALNDVINGLSSWGV
jgi:hypothetical protein